MDEKTKQIQQERNKLFSDYNNNITPERMPVAFGINPFIAASVGGVDFVQLQFDYSLLEDAAEKTTDMFYSDKCPFYPASLMGRLPGCYQAIDSQTFKMGGNGFVQHPEVVGMEVDEYDDLIKDAYACIIEKVLPRQHKAIDPKNGAHRDIALQHLILEERREGQLSFPFFAKLMDKHGYYSGGPAGSGGFTASPYDFLSDQLRGFSNISKDIRRYRGKILEACDALLPLVFRLGLPDNPHPEGFVGMPLHMPTFMREKDFTEVWLPTFMKQVQQFVARGARLSAFCEHDWMRYLDYLQEFPAGSALKFEKGDPKIIKDKLGDKMMLTGLFPASLMRTGTKEQVLDKAKELLDIMMPGCGYIMDFTMNPLTTNDLNMDNYRALTEYLRDNAYYDNPGTPFGQKLNSENFKIDESISDMKSVYLTDWNNYKARYPHTPDSMKKVFEKFDNEIIKSYLRLLV